MTDKQLRRLSRTDLLEILIDQQERIEELTEENKRLRREVEDKRLRISRAGSLAEASLAVNRVFEAAQQAADQYLSNLRALPPESLGGEASDAAAAEGGRRRRRG